MEKTNHQAELNPRRGPGRLGGEAGAPSAGTSSGSEGPHWGAWFCPRKVPFQARGRAHPGVSAQTPAAWRTGAGVGALDFRSPGGQVPMEAKLHGKEFLPEGVSRRRCPPPAPQNEVLYPPGHLATLSTSTPSPAPAPSLIPCFPGWLAGGSSFCSLFWMDSDILREAEITRPESRPLARAPRQSEGFSRHPGVGGGWLPPPAPESGTLPLPFQGAWCISTPVTLPLVTF